MVVVRAASCCAVDGGGTRALVAGEVSCGRDGGVSWDAVVLRKSSRRRLRDGGGWWLPWLLVRRGGCRRGAVVSGGRRDWRRRLPWRVEGEEKIRVRVLGGEDDDVAESKWSIW